MTESGELSWPRRRLGEGLGGGQTAHRVIMIDDHALLGESVVMTLRQSGLDARTLAHDTPNLVEAVLTLRPDLVLLDLFLTVSSDGSMRALELFRDHGIAVVIITATSDPVLHARCLESGAAGVIEKSAPIERLIDAVHRSLRREPVMSAAKVAELQAALRVARREEAQASPLQALTGKERAVLKALTRGHSAGRIARDQGVSILTVRTHIRNLLLKLDVHTQLEAVVMAARERWFPEP